jgi:lipoate-protein ligase A
MLRLDLSFEDAAQNLALDEALIEEAESAGGPELLRFWECPQYFVVLGAGGKITEELNLPCCEQDNVPVLRRCSGGGTVLQGPGCLNYALVLDTLQREECRSIESTNRYVLPRICAALQVQGLLPCGTSDLAIGERKISGNAQRRKKRFLLFHGTILYGFDLARIPLYLAEPASQPQYRGGRHHLDFIANLGLAKEKIAAGIATEWQANELTRQYPHERLAELMHEKYTRTEWNQKF